MKKNYFVRVLSLCMVFCMVLTLVPSMSKTVKAAATGQQIVDEAAKYIGKVPYVYGGTKIDGDNPGADCSGFICRIYEKFGINMWANRTALVNCGTNLGTDLSVAQLGDIIWFSGHVAIYCGKDANGNHMIIHETGGYYNNVVKTKVSVVNAALRGIIRIPGVNNDGNTESQITVSYSADTQDKSRQSIGETNAVLASTISVQGASIGSVEQVGISLYSAANNLLADKREKPISKNGVINCWYDVNSELGVTLTPGTSYQYRFVAVIAGKEYYGDKRSFTTAGKAPTPSQETQPTNPPQETQPTNPTEETKDTTKPILSDVKVSNVTSDGYTVTCKATDNVGVTRVQFPCYTSLNDKDDLKEDWSENQMYTGTRVGNTYTYRVKISDHNNETGVYTGWVYAYDAEGNYSYYKYGSVTVPAKEEPKDDVNNGGNETTDIDDEQPQIILDRVSISKVQQKGSKKILVNWNTNTQADGYIVSYSTNKNFINSKTKIINSGFKNSVTLKKLKRGKTYYIRVKAFKSDGAENYYSDWSSNVGRIVLY